MEQRNVEWEYLQWLSDKTNLTLSSSPSNTYSLLLEQLYKKEFVWSVDRDENRAVNSMNLRRRFNEEFGGKTIYGYPTVLEVMIHLSDKLAFDMSEESEDLGFWFYILLKNSNLIQYTDQYYIDRPTAYLDVDDRLNYILNREYHFDGEGGFFPIVHPREDQRDIELWYQLSNWVLERSGYR